MFTNSTKRYVVTLLCLGTIGCAAAGIDLKSTQVTDGKALTEASAKSTRSIPTTLVYIDDITYRKAPATLLGKVLVARKGSKANCPNDAAQTDVGFEGRLSKLDFTEISDPEVESSIVVDRTTAGSVQFLAFVAASLSDTQYAALTVTNQVQRVDDGKASYKVALADFKRDQINLLRDADVCWVMIVDGYVHKVIISKRFSKAQEGVSGGFYGVKIGQNYYASDESNSIGHAFGVSVSIVKRPPGTRSPGELGATIEDVQAFQGIPLGAIKEKSE